jgi:hypothetical protein
VSHALSLSPDTLTHGVMKFTSQAMLPDSGVFLALLVVCCSVGTALGITYDKTPRPTILLSDSVRFIAEDGWNSMGLYRVSDARKLISRQATFLGSSLVFAPAASVLRHCRTRQRPAVG